MGYRINEQRQGDCCAGKPEIQVADRRGGLQPVNGRHTPRQDRPITPVPGDDPSDQKREEGKYQDMGQGHNLGSSLKTLVNPLRRLVGGQNDDRDQEQAKQQCVKIFTGKQFSQHIGF